MIGVMGSWADGGMRDMGMGRWGGDAWGMCGGWWGIEGDDGGDDGGGVGVVWRSDGEGEMRGTSEG